MVLFLFLDGVGLGPARPEANPFATLPLPAFERLAGGQRWTEESRPLAGDRHLFRPIDATLGVEGLPQSGTGQASLFTGVNCAALAGRHFGPYPHSTSKPVIDRESLFLQARRHTPEPLAFANAYPAVFFERAAVRDRWTVTTRCALAAGLPLRDHAFLARGEAVAADLTGRGWRSLGYDLEPLDEREAGRRLARLARRHALTLFEYYLTDKAGHARDPALAARVLVALDAFLAGLLEELDPETDLLLLTSDHGNLEDLSSKTHTRNPVPLVAFGRGAGLLAAVRDLTGVTPALGGLLA